MGLFGGDDNVQRFLMREKLLSIGDDYWIEDADGNKAFKVDGKAMRVRDTFKLEDTTGNEVAEIQERKLSLRDQMNIGRGGKNLVTVHKALIGIRDRFDIELEGGGELNVKGNFLEHQYEIKHDGDVVTEVSKKWVRVRETYGVEIAPGADVALMLAITVAIDSMTDVGRD